jgi:hypothetical protein
MTGRPQLNFPEFDRVARLLRDLGYAIVSPAELDSPEERRLAMNGERSQQSWGDFLSRDVKIIADQVQGIILMPGWEESRGARLEATVGLLAHLTFLQWDDAFSMPVPIGRVSVACALHKALLEPLT